MRRLDCGYALSAKYALRKYQNKMELFYDTWYYDNERILHDQILLS